MVIGEGLAPDEALPAGVGTERAAIRRAALVCELVLLTRFGALLRWDANLVGRIRLAPDEALQTALGDNGAHPHAGLPRGVAYRRQRDLHTLHVQRLLRFLVWTRSIALQERDVLRRDVAGAISALDLVDEKRVGRNAIAPAGLVTEFDDVIVEQIAWIEWHADGKRAGDLGVIEGRERVGRLGDAIGAVTDDPRTRQPSMRSR